MTWCRTVIFLLIGFLPGLTGCSGYSLVERSDQRPAQLLYWRAANPHAEVILHSVIVPGGSGSWVEGARWDEYEVQISNLGREPLVIGSVVLIDLLGRPQAPGASMRELARRSSANWPLYGKNVLLAAGAGLTYKVAAAAAAVGAIGTGSGAIAGGLGGDVAYEFLPAVLQDDQEPPDRFKIRANFEHVRFRLPVTIAPGARQKRSFFFPMTPGPQRLVIKGTTGDAPLELTLELEPLAGLHLKPATEMKTTPP